MEILISKNSQTIFCLSLHRSHLPARATRLLNRSRLQHSNAGSDSPRSLDSFHRRTPSNRPSPQLTRDSNGSLDDNISVLNESMRNVMLDDLLDFKKQLIRLRNVLQEVSSFVYYLWELHDNDFLFIFEVFANVLFIFLFTYFLGISFSFGSFLPYEHSRKKKILWRVYVFFCFWIIFYSLILKPLYVFNFHFFQYFLSQFFFFRLTLSTHLKLMGNSMVPVSWITTFILKTKISTITLRHKMMRSRSF